MSKVVIQGNASGTGNFTIAAPNSNTDRTFNLPDATGTVDRLERAGNVLQVVSTEKTDSFTTTATSPTDVTGMSATITPSSTSSKILIIVSIGAIGNNTGGQATEIFLLRDSSQIHIGDVVGLRTSTSSVSNSSVNYYVSPHVITHLDSPSTTSAITYKIQMATQTSGTATFNSRGDDGASSPSYQRTASEITLMEIAG